MCNDGVCGWVCIYVCVWAHVHTESRGIEMCKQVCVKVLDVKKVTPQRTLITSIHYTHTVSERASLTICHLFHLHHQHLACLSATFVSFAESYTALIKYRNVIVKNQLIYNPLQR